MSRPQPWVADSGVRKKPSAERGPKASMAIRQPPSTTTTGLRQSAGFAVTDLAVTDRSAVEWLVQDFAARKALGIYANPSERELFQLIEDHYGWCKCEGGEGLYASHTKASSEILFDYNEYLDEWGIPEDEEPPRWIA